MRVPLAVLADYANTTPEGKLNIMGIFNILFAPSVPVVHPQMQLVFKLQSEPVDRGETKKVSIKLLDADGRVIVQLDSTVQVPADFPLTGEIPQIIGLNGLRFERFGDHAFHITVNGENRAEVHFTVRQTQVQQPAG